MRPAGVSVMIFKQAAGQQLMVNARDKCDLKKPGDIIVAFVPRPVSFFTGPYRPGATDVKMPTRCAIVRS
jgi:hypothetical protein